MLIIGDYELALTSCCISRPLLFGDLAFGFAEIYLELLPQLQRRRYVIPTATNLCHGQSDFFVAIYGAVSVLNVNLKFVVAEYMDINNHTARERRIYYHINLAETSAKRLNQYIAGNRFDAFLARKSSRHHEHQSLREDQHLVRFSMPRKSTDGQSQYREITP